MASDASPDFRKVSISSMIVELANIVSFQDRNIQRLTYQSTLFPEPATKRESYQPLGDHKHRLETHVFHGSRGANSVGTISIPRASCHERTTPPSLCGAIPG